MKPQELSIKLNADGTYEVTFLGETEIVVNMIADVMEQSPEVCFVVMAALNVYKHDNTADHG